MTEKIATMERQLVVFRLGEETYAVDIEMIREIIQLQPITRVPGTAHSIEGVINLRGSIIPVVDLRKRFRLVSIEHGQETRIVVVDCNNQEVGVIVDSVTQVLRINVDSIQHASDVFSEEHLDHIKGIVKLHDELVILLDMDLVLSTKDIGAIKCSEILAKMGDEQKDKVAIPTT